MVLPQPLSHLPYHSLVRRRGRWDSPSREPPFHPHGSSVEQPLLLPLWTAARLPIGGAEVAELLAAPARHVVASVRELDEVAAARAALPALLLGEVQDLAVLRRVARMRGVVGLFALPACADVTARAEVRSWGARSSSQEGRAGWTMAIDTVRSAELESLLFKRPRDGVAEIATYVSQYERLLAAARRIQRLVDRCGSKEVSEAGDVVVMSAGRTNLRAPDGVLTNDTILSSTSCVRTGKS